MSILNLALTIGIGAVTLTLLLCGWRLLRGPTIVDRVLALDTLYLSLVALVVMLGLRWQTPLLFEAALIVALLGWLFRGERISRLGLAGLMGGFFGVALIMGSRLSGGAFRHTQSSSTGCRAPSPTPGCAVKSLMRATI